MLGHQGVRLVEPLLAGQPGLVLGALGRRGGSAWPLCTGPLPSRGPACYTLGMARKREGTRNPGRPISGKPAVPVPRQAIGTRLDALYRQDRAILEQARAMVARSVNTEMV